MNIKVLPLENWMKTWWQLDEEMMAEITPRFNRDGYYMHGGRAWFEYNGKAWKQDSEQFRYSLRHLNHRPLRRVEEDALGILHQNKLLDKSMQAMYYANRDWWQLRQTGRNVTLRMIDHWRQQ